jgi:cysteine desulfurase family protein
MKQLIYFDNASTTFPKPSEIVDYMSNYMKNIGGSPGRGGHRLARLADDYVSAVREKVASLFCIEDYTHLSFTSSATHSLNIAIKGYLKSGDHALVCNFSHNSALRPLNHLKKKNIITYDIFEITPEGEIDEEAVSRLIKQNTRLILCNHASNVIGIKAPIQKISKIARDHGLHFLLDCSQSALYIDIDVDRDGIDFLVGTTHKTFMGPSGVGFLYIKDGNLVDHFMEGGSGANHSGSPVHPNLLPHKFEAGTLNFLGIAGLDGSLSYIRKTGLECMNAKAYKLTSYALECLSLLPKCSIYGSKNLALKVPIISFNLENYRPDEVAYVLDKEYSILLRPGIQCAPLIHHSLKTLPGGTLRASFSHMNTKSEIDSMYNALRSILDQKK